MSRVGRMPITIPKGVKVQIVDDVFTAEGPKGKVSQKLLTGFPVKVEDGVIVIPMEAKGKKAVAEGTLTKIELTLEQAIEHARHMAEEQKKPFDPKSVTGPTVTYQLNGTGAVID